MQSTLAGTSPIIKLALMQMDLLYKHNKVAKTVKSLEHRFKYD
jgi:hypothetical protein